MPVPSRWDARCAMSAMLPQTYVDYSENPREYMLSAVQHGPRRSHARLRSLQRSAQSDQRAAAADDRNRQGAPGKRAHQQPGVWSARARCRVAEDQDARRRADPDDLDELIAKVWKEPAFFLAHPRAIAAFGRECTRRGVPPPTVTLFGSQFVTWRGIPLIPSDKIVVKADKTSILLIQTGEKPAGRRRPLSAGPAG